VQETTKYFLTTNFAELIAFFLAKWSKLYRWWRGGSTGRGITEEGRKAADEYSRAMAIYYCQRLCGYAWQEVADCFSLTHSGGVSSAVRVVEEKIERVEFKKRLCEIREGLNLTKLTLIVFLTLTIK